MQPFNLQQALAGKPLCNRKGDKLEVKHFEYTKGALYPIVIIFKSGDVSVYTKDGLYNRECLCQDDLFMCDDVKYIVIQPRGLAVEYASEEKAKHDMMPFDKLYKVVETI